MATQWFYTERGEQRGPVGFDDLKSRAEQGSLRPDDLVWGEGMPEWKPAAQIDGLPLPRTAPPPLPGQSSDGPPYENWDPNYRAASTGSDFAGTPDSESRQWAMFLHFSQFFGFVLPLAGLIVPIVIWQVKKDELPWLDAHGKNVVNWMISEIIYFFASVLLVIVIVGIPLLIAMGVCAIVFPIIGGIKANNGVVWRYPMSIAFFK
jgi:uncharacterized protein